MPTIRIENRLYEEAKDWLEFRGLYRKGMSKRKVIESCLSYLIHGTSNLKDGREMAGMILDEHLSPRLKGRVGRFVGQREEDQEVEAALSAKIRQAQRELTPEIEVNEDVERKEVDEIDRFISKEPPWLSMSFVSFNEIIARNPKHPAVLWANDDPLKRKALEVAWATIPISMHKTPKVAELALSLWEEFRRWELLKKEN